MEFGAGADDPPLVGVGRRTIGVATALAVLAAGVAHAEDRPPWRLRAGAAGGFVVSGDQHEWLALDLPVVEGRVTGGLVLAEVVVLELGLGGGAFFSSSDGPGGLVDVTVGAELGVPAGIVRPWASLHVGVGVTGDLARPILRVAAGLDVAASEEIALGPVIGYGHVFQEDGEGFTDDASFLSLGLSLTWRPPSPAASEEPPAEPLPEVAALEVAAPRSPPLPPPPVPAMAPEALMTMIDEAAGLRPRELLVPVLFEFDSTEIVGCSVASLHALREHLEANPSIRRLEIEGHADGSGSDAYNDALSLARAEVIRDWLVARGVDPARLTVSARGERAPVEEEGGDEGDAARAQNRRVRFLVVDEGAGR